MSQSLCTDDRRILRANCAHCLIRKKMLFAELDVDKAAPELAAVTNNIYTAGDVIYGLGEEAKALYSVRKGIIKLSLVSPEGEVRIVRLLGPGAVIGLEAQMEQAYEHTAQCLTAADVCRIPAVNLHRLVNDQSVLYRGLIQQWHEHIELADRHLLDLSSGSVKERVLRLLALLEEMSGLSDSPLLLPTNQDCATIVGARIESVSRVMAELKRAGILLRPRGGDWEFNPQQARDST